MGSGSAHVGVRPGDGLVARYGDTVVFLPPGSSDEDGSRSLLAAVERHAGSAAPAGEELVRELAAMVAAPAGPVPPFGLVAPVGGGWAMVLHGLVAGELTDGPETVERLDGTQAVTIVDRKFEGIRGHLGIGCGDPSVAVDPRSDLRDGAVPAGGFVLTPWREVGEHSAPVAGARGGRVPGGDVGAADTPVEHVPEGDAAGADAPDRGDAWTVGSTEAAARPVGYLLADDGMRIPLDRAYVLGREPEADPEAVGGEATPIRIHDEHHMVSRVQTRIRVESGRVLVSDAGSSNGTYIAAPGAPEWTRLGTDAVTLPPAWNIRIGKVILTFVIPEAPR